MTHLDQAIEKVSDYVDFATTEIGSFAKDYGTPALHEQAQQAWITWIAKTPIVHTPVDRARFISGYVACALQAAEAKDETFEQWEKRHKGEY